MSQRGKRARSPDITKLRAAKRKQIDSSHQTETLQDIAHKLRIHSVQSTQAAGTGHPTSCASIAEIFSVLFFDASGMKYHAQDPGNANNDRLVLSKGHAAPILYAAWAEAGFVDKAQLLNLRKLGCELEGHPLPHLPFVDVATGSLGQGICAAAGMAYTARNFEKSDVNIFCVLGDGESAEGSVWEALNFASFNKLGNLCVIVDVNRLGQSDPAPLEHDMATYRQRFESFGCQTIAIDGHDITSIIDAFETSKLDPDVPTAILAMTYKGKYFTGVEDNMGFHGQAMKDKSEPIVAELTALIKNPDATLVAQEPTETQTFPEAKEVVLDPSPYNVGDEIATRAAYGKALAALGSKDERVIVLDADTKNSTCTFEFNAVHPARFIECYIAEQNMVGVGMGVAARQLIPFVNTFAAFHTRAFDFIRMAGISQLNLKVVGSHCGVSIGEDGSSQMALEDIAMMRTIPDAVVLYPSDGTSVYAATQLVANYKGICYIRNSRPITPVIYPNTETFEIGKLKVVEKGEADKLTVVAAGITLHEAKKAAAELKGTADIRVIDLFSIMPIDREGLIANATETGGKILTVEDHYRSGGIYEAVCSALATEAIQVHGIYVSELPHSGKPDELIHKYGLSASKIAEKVREILG